MTRSATVARLVVGVGLAAALGACAQMQEMGIGLGTAEVAMADDACGAGARQGLVGTSVGQLDAATLPENRRVIFPGMAVTQDFRPERLNVEVGADDRIARVYCG